MANSFGTPGARQDDSISALEAVAAARAARLGKSVDQLLADDRQSLQRSAYPTADCFMPHEIEQFARGDLAEQRMGHAESCAGCAALLQSALSWERPFDVFMDEVRNRGSERTTDDLRQPFTDAVVAGGPIVILGLVACAWWGFRDWNPDLWASIYPVSWLPIAGLVVVALAAVAAIPAGLAVATRFQLQAVFARHGGAMIGGVFATIAVLLVSLPLVNINSNYQEVSSARELAIAIAAMRVQDGSSDRKLITIPTFTRTLTGAVEAEPRLQWVSDTPRSGGGGTIRLPEKVADEYHVYFRRNGKDRTELGKVYVGQFQVQSNGKLTVKTAHETIEVKAPTSQLSNVKPDEPVAAMVLPDAQEASSVLPVEALAARANLLAAGR